MGEIGKSLVDRYLLLEVNRFWNHVSYNHNVINTYQWEIHLDYFDLAHTSVHHWYYGLRVRFVDAKKISNLSVIDNKCVHGTVIQLIGCGTGLSVYNKQSWLHSTTNIRKETCRLNADHYPMKITTVSQSVGIFSNNSYDYTPPSKSLASLWLAGQLVVIPPLKWPYFQEYHTEYFKIPYDKY